MAFNRGFYCRKCGPIPKAKTRTIQKKKFDTCPTCKYVVKPWERPMNERVGRCSECGHGSFRLAIIKKQLIRTCKNCDQQMNTDTGEIIQKGRDDVGKQKT